LASLLTYLCDCIEPQTFTRKEFELINQKVKDGDKDAKKYIVIDNKLYDVTEFVEDHPGGEAVLMTHVGKDASGTTD
jgi:cytochrome b involved in lipid metabolism